MTDEISQGRPARHTWHSITDFSADDLAVETAELSMLASIWSDEKARLGDDAELVQFNERLQREWAIETGIIERIYSLDRGTTTLLIERGIDATFIAHDATDKAPELVTAIIRDHLDALDWLFEFVVNRRELTTSFIKELHALMTRHQVTTSGVDQFGNTVEVELLHGKWKVLPNNPTRPDGSVLEYAPPLQVDAEMDLLIELHRQHLEMGVSPELASA